MSAALDRIMDQFAALSRIPRRSGDEARIRSWLLGWAATEGLEARADAAGNVCIDVAGSPGCEDAPVVVLQGHMDMVCEKTPDSDHDFAHDPISLVRDGEWLTADRTTLGADNGIAIAMAMVAATDPTLVHPPLELLFTVDEESGLTGAQQLQEGWLRGATLVNLDSEDEGVITAGCAGGVDTHLRLPLPFEACDAGTPWTLRVSGMSGGHSGVDIHLQRANALRVLARVLGALLDLVRVADVRGGSAHNAIPRDAAATVWIEDDSAVTERIAALEATLQREFHDTDPGLRVTLEPDAPAPSRALTTAGARRLVDFLMAVPHGVAAMSTGVPDLVETSNNEARVWLEGDELCVLTSQRSSVMSRLEAHTARIEGVARLAGGTAKSGGGYPPWQPDLEAPLLKRCTELYRARFDAEAVVEVIHAGLECGLIGERYPHMAMVSIGPTIKFPHSPDERLHVPSVEKVWLFLTDILADLATEAA